MKNPEFQETGKFSSLPQQLRTQQLRKFIDGACTDQNIPSHDFKNLINTSDSPINSASHAETHSNTNEKNIETDNSMDFHLDETSKQLSDAKKYFNNNLREFLPDDLKKQYDFSKIDTNELLKRAKNEDDMTKLLDDQEKARRAIESWKMDNPVSYSLDRFSRNRKTALRS